MVEIVDAHSGELLDRARELFTEYAESLGFDLSFQDFEAELASLPGEFTPPDGRILLAWHDGQVAGCVALRRFGPTACEMKRLYVRPWFRGSGIGWRLATDVIEQARQVGYQEMLLDTVPSMTTAIALYESLGFEQVAPYRYNPIIGARFMRLVL